MQMKKCTGCKTNKSLELFSNMKRSKDGKQPQCKECAAAYYKKNDAKIKSQVRATNKARIEVSRRVIYEYLTENPCVDCGESDPIVLEFDHVRGDKEIEVTRLMGYSKDRIMDEISKCEVRCCNCHRRVTLGRMKSCYKIYMGL